MTEVMSTAIEAIGGGALARALGLHPRVLDLLTDRAFGLVRHGKLAEARVLLEDLARVDGESPVVPQLLGAIHVREGRLDAAVVAYTDALSRAGRAGFTTTEGILLSRAHVLLTLDGAAEAQADLEAVLAGQDKTAATLAQAALATLTGGAR
jgi:predicted Zn-dependent protease